MQQQCPGKCLAAKCLKNSPHLALTDFGGVNTPTTACFTVIESCDGTKLSDDTDNCAIKSQLQHVIFLLAPSEKNLKTSKTDLHDGVLNYPHTYDSYCVH